MVDCLLTILVNQICRLFSTHQTPDSIITRRNNVRVPRRDDYVKRPVLSATIHPDIKKTLVSMSERTGLSISQVTDEVLYTGLIEMQELPELAE